MTNRVRTCVDCLMSFWGDHAFELHRTDHGMCLRPANLGFEYQVWGNRIVWFMLERRRDDA